MRNDLLGVLNQQNSGLAEKFQDRINLENISRLGADQFLNNILKENRARIENLEGLLMQFQSKVLVQPAYADSIKAISESLGFLNNNTGVESQIELLKNKWINNGVLETIGSFEKEKQSAINKLMNDPEVITRIASQKFNLFGLKKILLNAKSLNLGASGISQGKLGINDAIVNGFNAEFLKKGRFFSPVIGAIPGIKSITDFNYSNFNELPNLLTSAIRMGKGDIQKDFSHMSLSLFQQSNNHQFLPSAVSASLSKNLVTTFSKRISFSDSHILLTEVSKSTIIYNPSSGASGDGIKGILGSENFLENMGVTLDYNESLRALVSLKR